MLLHPYSRCIGAESSQIAAVDLQNSANIGKKSHHHQQQKNNSQGIGFPAQANVNILVVKGDASLQLIAVFEFQTKPKQNTNQNQPKPGNCFHLNFNFKNLQPFEGGCSLRWLIISSSTMHSNKTSSNQ